MAGRLIGEAYIALLADATGFGPDADAKIKSQLAALRPKVKVTGDTADLEEKISAVAAALKGIDGNIKLTGTNREALGSLSEVYDALEALIARAENIRVSMDDAKALAQLYSMIAGAEELQDRLTSTKADININRALAKFYTLEEATDRLEASMAHLTADVDLGLADEKLAQLAAMASKINDILGNLRANITDTPAQAKIAGLQASLSVLLEKMQNMPADVNTLPFEASLLKMLAGAEALQAALAKGTDPARPVENLAVLQASATKLAATLGDMRAGVSDTAALAKIATLQAALSGLTSRMGGLSAGDSTASIEAGLLNMQAKIENVKAAANDAGAAAALMGMKFIQAGTGGGGAWGFLTNKIVLFAGVLDRVLPSALTRVAVWHVAADWIFEFAAVLGPAAIAVAAWGAAVAPVFADAANRMKAMQEAASATGTTIGIFNYNARGAVGPMQALQNTLQPGVWELTGDAIRVMTAKTGAFGGIVKQVNTVVEDLAARMTMAFSSGSATSFMKNGAVDFQRFGTTIANLGGAFGNFIKAVPGYAEVIQELFVKVSAGIETFTALTIPVMHAGLALHGFFLYTGLAVTAGVALITGLGNVIGHMFTFAAAAVDVDGVLLRMMYSWDAASGAVLGFSKAMLALLANPYVLGIAAIGLAVYDLTVNMHSASSGVTKFISSLSAIDTMQGGDALQTIPAAFGKITEQMKIAASPAAYNQIAANWNNLSNTGNAFAKDTVAVGHQFEAAWDSMTATGAKANSGGSLIGFLDHIGSAIKDVFVPGAGIANQVQTNIQALEASFQHLSGEQQNLFTVTGKLMTGQTGATKTAFSYAQSLGILDAAGVQASDSLGIMETKVQGLLTGWRQYGLSATQIGNSVNAIALSTEMQQSSVNTLASAYSNFISVVTGGEKGITTFGEGMTTLQQALSSSGIATYTDKLGTLQVKTGDVAKSMNGFGAASLNLRGAFAAQVVNAQDLYNSLLTLTSVSGLGVKGQNMLAQAAKDMVAQLLPLAKGSTSARAEVSALAQVAGGPATTSFQALSAWVGKTKNPMSNLNSIEKQLTVTSANLSQDAQNLAGAMGQTLTTAISGAVFAAEKGPQALQGLANALEALKSGKGSVNGVTSALQSFIPALVQMTGSIPNARNEFLTMATSMGIGGKQAAALWSSVEGGSGPLNAVAILTKEFNSRLNNLAGEGIQVTAKGAEQLWATLREQYLDTLSGKAYETQKAFEATAAQLGLNKAAADKLWTSLKNLASGSPYNVATNERISASGKVTAVINAPGMATVQGGGHMTEAFSSGAMAAGGVVRGAGSAGRDSVPAMLAPGELVIPASHAAHFGDAARKAGIPGFAAGGVAGQADQLSAQNSGMPGFAAKAMSNFATVAVSDLVNAAKSQASAQLQAFAGVGGISGNVGSYGRDVLQVLKMLGLPLSLEPVILAQMTTESGGNPLAVNRTDSNARAGHPSTGLMQVIAGTFDAYAGPYRNVGPFLNGVSVNPMANIYAGVNYAAHAYGVNNLAGVLGHGHGYAAGGLVMPSQRGAHRPHSAGGMINEPVFGTGAYSGIPYSFAENGPEQVIPGGQAAQGPGMMQPMTQTQGNALNQQVSMMIKLLQQMPYAFAKGISQGAGGGARHGYYSAQGT